MAPPSERMVASHEAAAPPRARRPGRRHARLPRPGRRPHAGRQHLRRRGAWHWTFSITHWHDGRLVMPNPIADVPGLWAATWVLQVMPVFFFVGGYANLAGWQATERDGTGGGPVRSAPGWPAWTKPLRRWLACGSVARPGRPGGGGRSVPGLGVGWCSCRCGSSACTPWSSWPCLSPLGCTPPTGGGSWSDGRRVSWPPTRCGSAPTSAVPCPP